MMTTYEMVAKSSHARGAEASNALVSQSEFLQTDIACVHDLATAKQSLTYLCVFDPLWRALDYGYKVGEMRNRLIKRVETLIRENEMFIDGERKTRFSKARKSAEAENVTLREFLDSMK